LAEGDVNALGKLFAESAGEVLLLWCSATTWRRDTKLARLLALAGAEARLRDRVVAVARARVVEGPLVDALGCAPLLGDGDQLTQPENHQARARLEILIWEAGASALEVPALGKWLWGSPRTFEEMIRGRDFFPDKYGLDLPADDHPARPEDRRAGRFLRAQRGRGGVERGSGCVARLHPGVKRLQ